MLVWGLYALIWPVAVVLVDAILSSWVAASGVLFVTCGLEFLQFWDFLELQAVREMFVGHALLGSTFSWWDLAHYGVGAVLGALLVRGVTWLALGGSADSANSVWRCVSGRTFLDCRRSGGVDVRSYPDRSGSSPATPSPCGCGRSCWAGSSGWRG